MASTSPVDAQPPFKRMELTITPPLLPLKGFLGLPVELRTIIYVRTLVEPMRWEKRHKSSCSFSPRDLKTFERPPFTMSDFHSDAPQCKCASRLGLGLLLANRQINREATPLFWTRNAHCFGNAAIFGLNVGMTVRPPVRTLLLRHVSLAFDYHRHPRVFNGYPRPLDVAFRALLQCASLQTLDLSVDYVPLYIDYIVRLPKAAPRLKAFNFVKCLTYDVGPGSPAGLVIPRNHAHLDGRRLLYVLVSRRVDLARLESEATAKEAWRDFETNFLVHVRFAIETQLMGRDEAAFGRPICRADVRAMRPILVEDASEQRLELRDGTWTTVQIFGQPISRATRLRHARERWMEERRLKAEGKPTAREEAYNEKVKELRSQKKLSKSVSEREDIFRLKERRKKRQAEDRKLAEEEEQNAEASRREEYERLVCEAKERRVEERRRVPGGRKSRETQLLGMGEAL